MKKIGKYKIISFLSTLMFLGSFRISEGGAAADAIKSVAGFPSWDEIQMWIANLIISLAANLLWVAGVLFNHAMSYTINIATVINNVGVVNIGWEIFRDLSNMVFIFILLIISITTILGLEKYNAKNLLVKVILVALLINFSLFTTKVIIDASNVFTIGFYNATISGTKTAKGETQPLDKGISAIFAQSLKLHSIYDHTTLTAEEGKPTIGPKNIWTICIFGSLFLLVTAFVFFAASILLIKRLVVLMFLMIISPLAFLGMILPATQAHSKKWWSMLFAESFYAPIYMMFTYVVATGITSLTFKKTIGGEGSGDTFASALTGNAGDGMSFVIFNFILIIGLMLASIISASTLGATGAGGMLAMGKKLQGWGQGKIGAGTFGAAGRFGRSTFGRGFNKIAESDRMKNWAAKGGGVSKLALKTLRGAGDSSFDFRNTAVGKEMKIGAGIKGGYATHRKEVEKERTTYGKSLKGDTGRMVATGRIDPVTGAPVMRDVSRTEAYGQAVQDRSVMSTLTGTTAANKKAGENLVKEFTYKRDLTDAKKVLKRLNDELTDLRKTGSGATPLQISDKRDEISDADGAVEKIKEKIKKLTETKK